MLTRYNESALKITRLSFFYLPEIPFVWDSKNQQIYPNKSEQKWLKWHIANSFLFFMRLTTLYALISETFIDRPDLQTVHSSILKSASFCFTTSLAGSYAVFTQKQATYSSALNEYLKLERNIYQKYNPSMLIPNRKMSALDKFFFVAQPMNFLSIVLYLNSIAGKNDGLYWILEDILPHAHQRNELLNTFIFILKSVILIPCFCVVCRAMQFSSLGYLFVVTSLKELSYTFLHKVHVNSDFFRYYTLLCILARNLRRGFERATIIAILLLYSMFIQSTWAWVVGFGKLEISVYMQFLMPAITTIIGLAFLLPLISSAVEVTNDIPKVTLQDIKLCYCQRASFSNRVNVKKAKSLHPIRLRFGAICPLGKDFSRAMVQSMIDGLFQLVITFELNSNQI